MPRPRHATGRPGTRVIPVDWETTHAVVADGTRTATVALRKPGGTTTFADHQDTTVPYAPYATGLTARIQAQTSNGIRNDQETADDTVHVSGYLITVTYAQAAVVGDDLVDVTSSNDPLLAGRTFRVIDVVRGSLRFERDLLCTLND